jgi:hypothetical protein
LSEVKDMLFRNIDKDIRVNLKISFMIQFL